MDNPFSPEQLQKFQEIAKLPAEQQKEVLGTFLKTLTPEQVNYLKQQQQQGGTTSCPFCSIAQKQMQALVLFEDATHMAVLDIRPATKGHTLLFPKQHATDFPSLPQATIDALFRTAQKVMAVLEETLSCSGSNIFLANGTAAGQTVDHVLLHVIPRNEGDGLRLQWEGKPAPPEELQQLQQQLAPKLASQPAEQLSSPASPPSKPVVYAEEEDPLADF